MAYSIAPFGAGIAQLVECQLPKLKVAGSNPVARSILFSIMLILALVPYASAQSVDSTLWKLRAGLDPDRPLTGQLLARLQLELMDYGHSPGEITPISPWATPGSAVEVLAESTDVEARLRERIANGDRSSWIPLVCFLVSRGFEDRAVACFESSGMALPATRRDLGIALSWFGRFSLYQILATMPEAPPDLADDDYGQTLAAVVQAGWMKLCPDGLFHGDELVRRNDLETVAAAFPGAGRIPSGDWFTLAQIDTFLSPGASYGR